MKNSLIFVLLLILVASLITACSKSDKPIAKKTEQYQDSSVHILRATNLKTGVVSPIKVPAHLDVYTIGDSVWVYLDDSQITSRSWSMDGDLAFGKFAAFRIEEDVCSMRSPEENAKLDSILRAVERKYLGKDI